MNGRVIAGRYRLERLLGEGAMGRVYLARDTKERGLVWAVKEISYSDMSLEEMQQARMGFAREADLLLKLSHACLPKVVGYFHENSCDYLVMERVEGPTLEGMLSSRGAPLKERDLAAVGWNVAGALDYLHSRNPPIIYRDVKPANIMVALDGTIKLIDFGIARAVNPARSGDTTAFGTPGYAPPEQYMGRSVPASDIYSLGVTLLRAACLYEPPEVKFTHPRAASINPKISPELDDLIASMLDKDWQNRPSAKHVKIACDVFLRFGHKKRALNYWSREISRLREWLAKVVWG